MSIRANSQEGFTLLELMVVIAIISILAAFSAPTFIRQITKAKLVEAQNIATQDQSIVEEYILLNGTFPNENQFDNLAPKLDSDSIVKSVSVSNTDNSGEGRIIITLNKDTGIDDGKKLTYVRNQDRHWHCQSDLKSAVLPPQCKSSQGE